MLTLSASLGSVLVDGRLVGAWRLVREPEGGAVLEISAMEEPEDGPAAGLEEEARALLRFLAPDAPTHDMRFVPFRT
jgi:hypothetical protein